jgi:PPE-repeat protein
VLDFSWLPTEINSLPIFAGAGSGPVLQSWDGFAYEIAAAAVHLVPRHSDLDRLNPGSK